MPRPSNLQEFNIQFQGGYFPSCQQIPPEELQETIRRGSNVWLRPGGKLEPAKGLNQLSATAVGARIFAADIQRASIAGGLVGVGAGRLPFAGLLRYQNAVLFFLSEYTGAQVFLNETAPAGLTTSATAGQLRVAVPAGGGTYNTFDAGFTKPVLPSGNVTVTNAANGAIAMSGAIGVAVAPWRTKTNAIGPPSDTIYNNVTPSNTGIIRIQLPGSVSGQDGWIYAGTRWKDTSGDIRVVRYVYNTPRGTFTATNASPNLTAGVGTFWVRDLRRGDIVNLDAGQFEISDVTSDTTAVLTTNYTGTTNPGKTMTMAYAAGAWYDSELGAIVSRDVQKPPPAAGVLQYAGTVFIWGVPDTTKTNPGAVTGNAILAMRQNNPEHVGLFAIATASGSDLVNVLGGDGPMYLMTTTSLEAVSFTGNPDTPYIIRIIAQPGFKATSNGVLYKDWFYGYNNRPLRTRARENIDVLFAQPVWADMAAWDAQRVMVAVDPQTDAILYMFDNGTTTVVIPYLAQLGVWSPPLNFTARIIDTAVVGGILYVIYLSGGNYQVNQWEGGAGLGGTMYFAGQYRDKNAMNRVRLKDLVVTGKVGSVSVFAATPNAQVPDVSNLGVATATFPMSNTDNSEPETFTNIEGRALAFRVDITDAAAGRFDKLVARGTPRSERR